MALCICGQKVDRMQSKLQCLECQQIFHPPCCNIRNEDLEFIIDSYKCMKCLSLRRSSLSPLAINTTLPLHAEKEDPLSSLTGCSNELLRQVDVDSASNIVIDELPNFSANGIPVIDNIGNSCDDVNCNQLFSHSESHTSSMNTEKITLDTVYVELISMRKLNENLYKLVSTLANDKAKLLTTVEDLKLSFENLQNSVTSKLNFVDCSPKRKKKKTANKTNSVKKTDNSDSQNANEMDGSPPSIIPNNNTAPLPADSYASLLRPSNTVVDETINSSTTNSNDSNMKLNLPSWSTLVSS